MQMKQMTMRVSKPIYDALINRSAQVALTPGELLRQIVSDYLSGQNKSDSEAGVQRFQQTVGESTRVLESKIGSLYNSITKEMEIMVAPVEKLAEKNTKALDELHDKLNELTVALQQSLGQLNTAIHAAGRK